MSSFTRAGEPHSSETLDIRPYRGSDQAAVRALFERVNRLIAPPHMRGAFEEYIAFSIQEEIGRIAEYYAERGGSVWVADAKDAPIVGMYGLERISDMSTELRRMYVSPTFRRRGFARQMLTHAENQSRILGCREMTLSTSELQVVAIQLYRSSGYELHQQSHAHKISNKTVGSGLLRFSFIKRL